MDAADFRERFEELTGHAPLPWQERLFLEYLNQDRLPAVVDVATGLGKTAVTALWLIAVLDNRRLPRRLVYVVDRRAVVDQATDFVEKLRERLPEGDRFPISTLRGQHIDNREWLDDPAQPAIIVGTVDMVGSRLLFCGYGVSRKMRPYHAGLLGADTLVVLDEAHLVPPFERLLESVEMGDDLFGPSPSGELVRIPPLRLLSLSATGRPRQGEVFALLDTDLGPPGSVTRQRLDAEKYLELRSGFDPKQRPQMLASAAWELSGEGTKPMRCLVYCNSRDDAEKVQRDLADRIKRQRKQQDVPPLCEPELFIGARRGHERQLAAESLAVLGFLADSDGNDERLRFLIATSAGEVGVDLDADHMVCDLVAWERMVQRLGRVNRRGKGRAQVVVFDFDPADPKSSEQTQTHAALRAVLAALPETEAGRDVSPGALRVLKLHAGEDLRTELEAATTSAPLRPALSRPLVDAWSMTTLREHTGRPEVQPWLRGWVDEPPQTALVWRAHLPVAAGDDASLAGRVEPKAVEEYFDAAPPHAEEKLETETYRIADWWIERAKALLKVAVANRDKAATADHLQRQDIIGIALGQAGDFERAYRLGDLDGVKKDRLARELAGRTLVVRSAVGGLADIGTLDAKHGQIPAWVADDDKSVAAVARGTVPVIPWQVLRWDGGDDRGPAVGADWHLRHQFVLARDADGEIKSRIAVYQWRQAGATEDGRSIGYEQSLADHQACAEAKASAIAKRLGLTDWAAQVLVVAARLHDEGKRAERWQTAFRAPRGSDAFAKTKGPIDQQILDGYRHELGSLFRAEREPAFQALAPEQQDLVLHLIAAHHGQARPTIITRSCDDAPPSLLDARASEVALRFARLQRRWGPWGLAWWEALLRGADQQASKAGAEEKC